MEFLGHGQTWDRSARETVSPRFCLERLNPETAAWQVTHKTILCPPRAPLLISRLLQVDRDELGRLFYLRPSGFGGVTIYTHS